MNGKNDNRNNLSRSIDPSFLHNAYLGFCFEECLEKSYEIVSRYGKEKELQKALEELEELKEAISVNDYDAAVDELADVIICGLHILNISGYDLDELISKMEYKLWRTLNLPDES